MCRSQFVLVSRSLLRLAEEPTTLTDGGYVSYACRWRQLWLIVKRFLRSILLSR